MILINIIKIVFVLGFLVFIHEGGHFLVAKLFKVKVQEFSIGFGNKLISKQMGETLYSIRMIALGGYVKMLGEEERSDDERSFSKQSIPKRIAICAAGGIVNILFGIMVYFLVLLCVGNYTSKTVDSILKEYAAEEVGIMAGDEIVSIDGKKVYIGSNVTSFTQESEGKEVEVVVNRNGEELTFRVVPTEVVYEEMNNYKRYYLGVVLGRADRDFGTRLYYSWYETGDFVLTLADNVKGLFTSRVSVNDMTGPIGISKTVADTSSFEEFFYLMALISVSLGITNLLPIPALDGGKILIYLIEAIRRKPMKETTEIYIQMIGFTLLIMLSVYVSYIDIQRFF